MERCNAEGLVGAEGFTVDASLIRPDVHRQRAVPGKEMLPSETAGRAVAEYLAVQDEAAFGSPTPVTPKRTNITNPASRWAAATRASAFYAYSTNCLTVFDHAVIADVEATTAVRQAEVLAQRRIIERTQDRLGLRPERLVADTAYGSAPNLAWLVGDRGIEPHIPAFDKSPRRADTFDRPAFIFDHEDDSCICRGDDRIRQSNRNFSTALQSVNADGFIRHRARDKECGACGLKEQCTPKVAACQVRRSVHEGARYLARDIATSDAYLISRRQRKKVEMLFAHLKRKLKLDRLRLRGPNGANEFHLASTCSEPPETRQDTADAASRSRLSGRKDRAPAVSCGGPPAPTATFQRNRV